MDEPGKAFAPDLSPAQSKQWIGRLLIAVVLGVAIWNFVVSLTTAVILPGLARVMETDPQSPLSLGKGEFNVPGIFAAVLELCLALIAALIVNSWAQRRPRMVARRVRSEVTTSIVPPAPVRAQSVPPPALAMASSPAATAEASPPQAPAPAAKAKKPKDVYYNIVGEPIDSDE